jgi:hypothetical protein
MKFGGFKHGEKLIYIIFIVLLMLLLSCTKMETDKNDKGSNSHRRMDRNSKHDR